MSYRVTITEAARKELRDMRGAILKRVTKKLLSLGEDPRPPGCLKLKGNEGDMWRVRVGDHRDVYTLEDVLRIVDIRKIGHRGDIYDR